MRRLNVFIKGNVDVHDSLVYSQVGGEIQWNGLNVLLAERFPDVVARMHHEPCARWDRMGIEEEAIPAELAERGLNLGALTLERQFRSKMFERTTDVVVLSILSDVGNALLRHRTEGYSFCATTSDKWSDDDRRWVKERFALGARLTPEESMTNLARVVETIRARSKATILVYNMSSVVPGEQLESPLGLDDALSTRIRAYNLELVRFARDHAVLVVDVDSVVARAGADRLKLDTIHYLRDGYELIAREALRVLESAGLLDG